MYQLKHKTPLTQGTNRGVYLHPDNKSQLIKIMLNNESYDSNSKRNRFLQYQTYLREIKEFLATQAHQNDNTSFLQNIIGFAKTDLGLGLVVEAYLDDQGNLAPTLKEMVESGKHDKEAQLALRDFEEKLLRSNVVVCDLHLGNLVYCRNSDGSMHFVLIDGIGITNLIPVKAYFQTLNRKSKLKKLKGLHEGINRRLSNSQHNS